MPTNAAHSTVQDWIAREAVPFSLDPSPAFDAAVDRIVAALGGSAVEVLGFGEALHGGEEILVLRNRLFARLVAAHGFTAVAVESSFPRGRAVDDYVGGRGGAEGVWEAGFSHGFGRLDANRELVEWMRRYNAASSGSRAPLRFYGFDAPTEMTGADSPRRLLMFVLDYLASISPATAGVEERRGRIAGLLGPDADWENPATTFDPSKSIGLTPAAASLRVETEELVAELALRRPELTAAGGPEGADRYAEAVQHAAVARDLLTYHAALARTTPDRVARCLGIRDLIMADNLVYMAARERTRGGRILAFAHNSHLKRGRAEWQWGPDLLAWWPAGAHLARTLGPRYAVLGTGVATSDANGIAPPDPGTLEARLAAAPGPIRFVPTHLGQGLPAGEVAALPGRGGSKVNPTYFPVTPQSVTDFDGLAVFDSVTHNRGGPHIPVVG